jgi:chromosome segregation ATPase
MRTRAWLAAVAAAAVFGGMAVWQYRAGAAANQRAAMLESENRELRARSEQAPRESETVRQTAPAPEREAALPPRVVQGGENIEHARLLIQLREKLAAANQSVQQLDIRVRELEGAIEKVNEENKRLAASEAEVKESLTSTSRVLDALRAELKGKDERITSLMATNNQLLAENRKSAERVARLPGALTELEELNRRRETHVTNILRRYREIADQYRSVPSGADQSAELARVNNAIQMAEEDVRQLGALNAQAARIQQRLR